MQLTFTDLSLPPLLRAHHGGSVGHGRRQHLQSLYFIRSSCLGRVVYTKIYLIVVPLPLNKAQLFISY